MGLMSIFKKEEQLNLKNMPKKEKRSFLNNDLIERMIRIEQKLSGSCGGGFVPYSQTEYFKSLNDQQKAGYKKYLESKEKRKKWKFLPFTLIIIVGIFMGSRLTGNVVGSSEPMSFTNIVLMGILLLVVLIYLEILISERNRWKRMEKHFSVLEKIVYKRKNKQ
jgi:hypothetical protein